MDESEAKKEPEVKKFRRILRLISEHPGWFVFIFVASLSSIVAVGPAFFPWWTAPKRELAYCINPVRTRIVQSTNTSELSVAYPGRPVAGNVIAATIAIWNNGTEPIIAEKILS